MVQMASASFIVVNIATLSCTCKVVTFGFVTVYLFLNNLYWKTTHLLYFVFSNSQYLFMYACTLILSQKHIRMGLPFVLLNT